MSVVAERVKAEQVGAPLPDLKAAWEQVALYLFTILPGAAFIAAGFMLWGRLIRPLDLILFFVFYAISGHGITLGFHRYFTHGSFKANRGLKIALGVAGSLAIQGPITRWVADHRKHHAFSDHDGDPHSPWAYGRGAKNMVRGFWHSHMGWLFDPIQTD
jgi:stearoyl-CoA desaturase (delta-9 desaturase)